MSRFLTDSLDGVEIIRANGVIKHYAHTQSDHGNWARGGMGAGVAESILTRVRENGGLSVNMVDGSEPTSGYMVAKGAQFGSIVSADDFYDPIKGPKILADYFKQHKKELGRGKNYLGLWHNKDDGQVYLDVSENIQDRERAISAGQKQDQISIWDVTNFAEIETGGTGNVGKTRSGRDTKEHRRYERFRNRSLRPENLGEVGKAYKVIRFAPGLIPVFKHQEHDQSTHGSWARGISAEDEELISQMSTMGPSKEDILNAITGGEQAGYQDLIDYVNNHEWMYKEATEGIEERVAALVEENKYEYEDQEAADRANEELANRLFDQEQEKMIQEYVDADDGTIAEAWQADNGGSFNEEDLHGPMDEVYGMSHEVTDNAGNVVTVLSSQTTSIYQDGGTLVVSGQIVDSDGNYAGEFQRTFYIDTNQNGEDVLVVEHDLFKMEEEYRGAGFGTKFLAQQEAYYVSKGIDAINVGTAWDGARHWARAGFDFNPKYVDTSISDIARRVADDPSRYGADTEAGKEFDALMSRATNGYTRDSDGEPTWDSLKSMKDDNFPTPNDFAMIGYGNRIKVGTNEYGKPIYGWDGKDILDGLFLKYTKGLTQEGRTLNQGPIDRDGDGLVYDGTAREKPASAVNSTP
jgi:hypothetical protein